MIKMVLYFTVVCSLIFSITTVWSYVLPHRSSYLFTKCANVARGEVQMILGTPRRQIFFQIASTIILAAPLKAISVEKVDKRKGQQAYSDLKNMKADLIEAGELLKAIRLDDLMSLLNRPPSTTLEQSLLNLVNSNVLEREDKIAVGTIRRYGIAADVLITLGGFKAAVNDADIKEASKSLVLVKNSLDDVLKICAEADALK